MARITNLNVFCQDIANSIRFVDGTDEPIPANTFAPRIAALIEGGPGQAMRDVNAVLMPGMGLWQIGFFHEPTKRLFMANITNNTIAVIDLNDLSVREIYTHEGMDIRAEDRFDLIDGVLYFRHNPSSVLRPLVVSIDPYTTMPRLIPRHPSATRTSRWVIVGRRMFMVNDNSNMNMWVTDLDTLETTSFLQPLNRTITGLVVVGTRIYFISAVGTNPNNIMWFFDTETNTFHTFTVPNTATNYGHPILHGSLIICGVTTATNAILSINTENNTATRHTVTGSFRWQRFVPFDGGICVFAPLDNPPNMPVLNLPARNITNRNSALLTTGVSTTRGVHTAVDGHIIYFRSQQSSDSVVRINMSMTTNATIFSEVQVSSRAFAFTHSAGLPSALMMKDKDLWIAVGSANNITIGHILDTETGELGAYGAPLGVSGSFYPMFNMPAGMPTPLAASFQTRFMFFMDKGDYEEYDEED